MFDFKELEERILRFWQDNDIFRKSMDARRDAKPFVFFEGPPTANASPAIHHFIGRVFKDVIPRYQTMRGRYVLRKGGWDTHGLPVELQVEKALGFKSKKDIEAYGVSEFNKRCRESVWKNKEEWERFTRRIGFWVDLDNPYITYENPYMESLWNIIGTFWDKKLLYQAHRVVPFCTRCGTPLSSHEVAQGYKTVTDTSVFLKFKVKNSKLKLPRDTFIVAWTTTPWTLPGNVALAVGPDMHYVLARHNGKPEHFIIAADLASQVLGAPLAIDAEFTGNDLVGTSYEPLFPVKGLKKASSYKVYPADFVSTTDGTGVVHTAVMYGEDDYQLGTKLGLVKQHTVTEQGTFVGVSKELDGKYVKAQATEDLILAHLESRGMLLRREPYEHEYPFCWRCDTPLLYYAKDSWFVRMSALNKDLLANNATVNWVPAHLRDGRFGQWLREGKDWAFSRERYWGTPLPIWRSKDGKQTLVVSSLDDLDTYRADNPARLWVMRHGESTKNIEGIIDQGEGESPLTEAGRQQVLAAAIDLKKQMSRKRAKVSAIVASPVQRTRETAELTAGILGIKKVIYDDDLREINLGPSLVGCHDTKYHELYPTYESKFTERPPGGESLTDLKARMWGVVRRFNKTYAGKNVLVVSHEYPIWMLADAANGWTMRESISENQSRGDEFISFAHVEPMLSRNIPRDEAGNLDMHRPYIDAVQLRRKGSKAVMNRVPELCDVWFDSGSMPFAQWHWPFENDARFKEQFPADFIAEGIDQTRGWFYTLLAVSTALGKGAPYRAVLSYSHVLDEKGQKMSKSKGNIVKPDEVIDAVGVDVARWYFYTVNNPGDSKLFSMKEMRERLTGFMGTLQNCLRFWELYAASPEARNVPQEPKHLLDRWILSRLHGLIRETTQCLDVYDLTGAARGIEQFLVDDLSQWWLRRSRKRPEALGLLRAVLLELDKLLAPFVPFTAEDMHMRLHTGSVAGKESVHLHDWPLADSTRVNEELEQHMTQVREFISSGLAIRKEQGIRVRQPLASVTLPVTQELPPDLAELVKEELNVKQVLYDISQSVILDTHIGTELRAEGFAREIARTIQDMRKEAGLQVGDKVYCQWFSTDVELVGALTAHTDMITRDTGLSAFVMQEDRTTLTLEKNFEVVPGKSLWIGIQK